MLRLNAADPVNVQRCIHECIEEQVTQQPSREAICAWDGTFGYNELWDHASSLASYLTKSGIGPGSYVPICFDKSKWSVVAMLGILMTRGCLVSLDPSHPTARLQKLVCKVEAKFVLCSPKYVHIFSRVVDEIFGVDQASIENLTPKIENVKLQPSPRDNAYVIFTSGTTGEPKGVMISHCAFLSSVQVHSRAMLMDSRTRALHFSAPSFDPSLTETLTTLTIGGCVCIPNEEERLENLEEAIRRMRVNWAVLTPAFIKTLRPAEVPGLRTLVTGGEVVAASILRDWGHIALIQNYGPAEASVLSHATSRLSVDADPRNIGRPLGIRCWVVDRNNHDRLLPLGCPGELLLEGFTLSDGYLGDGRATTAAFIVDPAWCVTQPELSSGRRMYKTGDIARCNADGSYQFLSRKDSQIKLRGQRVEVAEIEHQLRSSEAIQDAIVSLPRKGVCHDRVVAVVRLSDDTFKLELSHKTQFTPLHEKELMDFARRELSDAKTRLSELLPGHMIPSVWLCSRHIPRLTSGKLDRQGTTRWLADMNRDTYHQFCPELQVAQKPDDNVTNVEEKMRVIWSSVLDTRSEQIDIHSPFLAQGGDSITAMQIARQCRLQGLGLSVKEILRCRSIKHLITSIKTVVSAQHFTEKTEEPFELSPVQQLYFSRPGHERGHFNQSFWLRCNRVVDENALREAIETLVSRHSMLRARFAQTDAGTWKQRITNNVSSSFRLRSHKVGAAVHNFSIMAESHTCLNEMVGPLLAADLIGSPATEQSLFMTVHHLVVDLVSWRILLNELEKLLMSPTQPFGSDTPMSFQPWCKLQWEDSQALEIEKVLPTREIPASNLQYWGVAGGIQTYGEVLCRKFELDVPKTSPLLTTSHHALRTELPDLLVAALILSFRQTFRDREVPPIFSEGHGRETWDPNTDLSGTVGWFTTMYPVFVDSSNDWIDVVRAVKDLRRQIPENGRQYWASRWLTAGGRDAFSHHAPMEVTFNYLGQYQQLEREDALFTAVNQIPGEVGIAGAGSDVGRNTPCISLIEISAVISQGIMRFSFIYNENMQRQDGIEQWITACQEIIPALAKNLSELQPQLTPGDFPLLGLEPEPFHKLVSEMSLESGKPNIDELEDIYPCSPIQQGLLISTDKDPALYSISTLHEVRSKQGDPVDAERLVEAWRLVVDRHPILRTVFVEGVGQRGVLHNQVVLRHAKVCASVLRRDKEEEAISCLSTLPEESLNMSGQLLHRFTICETPGKVFSRLEISHAISDGTSLTVLFRELMQAYDNRLRGPGPLFSNFISYIQRQPILSGVEYWKRYLSNTKSCHLPTLNDGEARSRQLKNIKIEFAEFAELQKFCQTRGVTLSNAIHAAWSLTLRCFTDSDQVCFGYVTSMRDAPVDGIETAIGPFINMLVCDVDLTDNHRLIDVALRIQNDHVDSAPHRHVALTEVFHALQLSSVPGLFNTALSYRRITSDVGIHGHSIEFIEQAPAWDPDEFSASINVEAADDDIQVYLNYWTNVICKEQADSIADTFAKSLHNMLHYSDKPIKALSYLGDQSKEQIFRWNDHELEVDSRCIHSVVEQQARERPEAAAVSAWDADFTYSELESAANSLSALLIQEGLRLEEPVLLCFEKSAYVVVAMLAVLKAGGVCVPLDSAHPSQMLEHRARDSGARFALSTSLNSSKLPSSVSKTLIVDAKLLYSVKGLIADHRVVQPSNASFIIYTSGSTGISKGVVLDHQNITSSAMAHAPLFGYQSDTRILQFASHAFDVSVAEIFYTLQRGGCVCVASDHDRLNNLAGAVGRLKVNLLELTPSVAMLLKPADVPTLKRLALGGERITARVIDAWRDAAGVSIHCGYGPTECSINSTYSGESWKVGKASNIGRAYGSLAWIVSASNHNILVPVGCEGELLLEGPIVSRGYFRDPVKTAASFIENPTWLSNVDQKKSRKRRMYKTGDIVRYDSNGTMVYIGRKDHQIKLNGQRVEIGEIESQAARYLPEGGECAIEFTAMKDGHSKKELIAFFSLQNLNASVDNGCCVLPMNTGFQALSDQLQGKMTNVLSEVMIPKLWIPVSRLPLLQSAKLDRGKLRQLASSLSFEQAASYRLLQHAGPAPSSEIEKLLAQLWGEVLHIEVRTLGIESDFFKLGGDSLGAINLITAARLKGLNIAVADVFRNRKLADMAASLNSTRVKDSEDGDPFSLIRHISSDTELRTQLAAECRVSEEKLVDIYPCTPLQEGLMALSVADPGGYVAQTVHPLPQSINLERFKAAWTAVVDAEAILRTRIVHVSGVGFLEVIVEETIAWKTNVPVVPSRHLPEYNGGPLVRFDTRKASANSGLEFIWTIHHALFDGWCLSAILEKVEACYRMFGPLKIARGPPFSRFIKHLTELISDESDVFWKSELADMKPLQFPRVLTTDYQGNAPDVMNLRMDICYRAGSEVTAASTLRAAWAMVATMYSGSDDVVFYETVNGREAPVSGITNMIGPTLATVPRSFRIRREQTVVQFLRETQSRSVGAIPHQQRGLQNIKRLSSDASQACNSQTLIAINGPRKIRADGLWTEHEEQMAGTNFFSYPLMVSFHLEENVVEVVAHYDNSLLAEWKLKGLLHCFEFVAQRFNSGYFDHVELGKMEVLSPQGKSTIKNWNGSIPAVVNRCIHDFIQERALQFGETKPAIHSWDGLLTYQQLDRLSTNLAYKLISIGIKHEAIVPLCTEKSIWAVVAAVAVLKSRAAFILLDPSSDREAKLQAIVRSVGAETVLCSSKYEGLCRAIASKTVVVNQQMVETLPLPASSLPQCTADSAAYAIFTSGTTSNRPKGMVTEHRAFCSGAIAHASAMGLDTSSRVLQFASHSFDASILEIFTTLIAGGCVCIPDDEARLNEINEFVISAQVNFALLTPSVAQAINLSEATTLRTLVLGGEALSPTHLDARVPSKTRLINGYGLSETAVVATVNPKLAFESSLPNIGRSVGGRCWVVDALYSSRLAPIGCTGELVIESPALARGYLNDEKRTAASFLETPEWGDNSSFKFYKTGDLVRYAADGSLLYLGRKDSQVKVRGQRVDLEELELSLQSDDAVRKAVVIFPTSGRCKGRLLAIIVLQGVGDPESGSSAIQVVDWQIADPLLIALRDRFTVQFPSQMVPAGWVACYGLPLLPSGKVDRTKIHKWAEAMEDELGQHIFSPCNRPVVVAAMDRDVTETELLLRSAWARVLKLSDERISMNQSFIQLGGDSLSAISAVSHCRSTGMIVTVRSIMQSKSIVDLATQVRRSQDVSSLPVEIKIGEEFDVSPIQKLYFDHIGNHATRFAQSVTLRSRHNIEEETLKGAIESLLAAHAMLRARFRRDSSDLWKQRIVEHARSNYRILYCSDRLTLEQIATKIEQSKDCLNAQDGPLFVVAYFSTLEESACPILSLAAHHLVVDVVSWRIIVEDIEQLVLGNRPSSSSSLSFQRWSKLQEERALCDNYSSVLPSHEIPEADLAFWQMKDVANLTQDIIEHKFELDTSLSMLLLEACRQTNIGSPVDLFVASLLKSFATTFPNKPATPPIYNEGHGREPWDQKLDLSQTVGWFTTLSPIYLPAMFLMGGNILQVCQWIKEVREQTPENGRSYFAFRSLTAKGSRFAGHWPMEISFNYLGQLDLDTESAVFLPLDWETQQFLTGRSDIGANVPRVSLIDISVFIQRGRIVFSFQWNKHMKHQILIKQWINACEQFLGGAIDSSVLNGNNAMNRSFPHLSLSDSGLNKLAAKLESIEHSIYSVEGVCPCSPVQAGIIFAQGQRPEYYAYRTNFKVRSAGPTHSVATQQFATAWQEVIHRHAALRTIFVDGISEQGEPHQIVLKRAAANITWLQCTKSEVSIRLASLTSRCNSQGQPPHHMTICTVVETGEIYCSLEVSHAIMDGSSISIVLCDLVEAYQGQLPHGPTKPVYRDHIAYLKQNENDSVLSYWLKYLEGAEPCYFPNLNEKQAKTRELCSYRVCLSSWMNVSSFASRNGITPSSIFQMAWAVVLRLYTNSTDVSFGYLTSGRDLPVEGIEDAVGCFINMLVCRFKLADDLRVQDVLEQIKDDTAEGLSNQNVSLAVIQHELKSLSGGSLFNSAYSFQKRSKTFDEKAPALEFDALWTNDPSEYAITLNIEVLEDMTISCAEFDLCYWSEQFSDAEARNVALLFEHVVTELVGKPNVTVGELDLLGNHHLQQIAAWNHELPIAIDACIHEIFARNVCTLPKATQAVCGWDRQFTYEELDHSSSLLAKHLMTLGIGSEIYVPLCFEKSAYVVVAMLAVLKAGGAFVPLDANHPQSRLQEIVTDTQSVILLCSPQLQGLCDSIVQQAIVLDDRLIANILVTDVQLPPYSPESAAYVIYTSGSTGTPKGIVIDHKAFCSSAISHGTRTKLEVSSRVLQFASYAFDASIMEILTTLVHKACVCIPSEVMRLDDLPGAMNELRVTWALLTPSMAQTIQPSMVPNLRTLVFGGEVLSDSHICAWSASNVSILNAYGPSECAIVSTVNTNGRESAPENIGRAVGGRCWIVDAGNHNRLVPIGSVGELVIEGPILARGYHNDSKRSNETFIDRPQWASSHAGFGIKVERIYKTGDLVRYSSDGSIVFQSRKDTQVKLRGQRFEVTEVEHHLKAVGGVERVFVTVPKSGSFKDRLVAALTIGTPERPLPHAIDFEAADGSTVADHLPTIRNCASEHLPTYMVPSKWLVVKCLPLTTSAKLDRKRITQWIERMNSADAEVFRSLEVSSYPKPAKETPLELHFRAILAQSFDLPEAELDFHQSFLHHGGDSITAMQVVARCRSDGINLSVQDVIQCKSIQVLIGDLATRAPDAKKLMEVSLKTNVEFCLSPIQQLWFDTAGDQCQHFNQSMVLTLGYSVDAEEVKCALNMLVESHPMLRARFSKGAMSVWQQRIVDDVPQSYRFRQHGTVADSTRLINESQHSLDIKHGPLLAADVFQLRDSQRQHVSIIAHHLVVDVVSWQILVQDLEDILTVGQMKHTGSMNFQAWCSLQAEHGRKIEAIGEVLPDENVPIADFSYWNMQQRPNQNGQTRELSFELDVEATTYFLEDCHHSLRTDAVDLCLTALLASFRTVFDNRNTAIYNESHGREPWRPDIDVSRTVGWFTTLSPVWLHEAVKSNESIIDSIKWVKDLRRRTPGKGRPYFYSRMLDCDGKVRFANHSPMEITFNYLGQIQRVGSNNSLIKSADLLSESGASDVGETVPRISLFDVVAFISNGRLKVAYTYHRDMYYQNKIQDWVLESHQLLRTMVDTLTQIERQLTMDDFPLLPLRYNGAAIMGKRISEAGIVSLNGVDEALPCSAVQHGMLLKQMEDYSCYNYRTVFRPLLQQSQTINTEKLMKAWSRVVQRHQALRAIFIEDLLDDGNIYQVVLNRTQTNVTWLECSDGNPLDLLTHQPPRKYNRHQPPHHFTFCRSENGDLYCSLEMSHVIVDGTSVSIILHDLAYAYEGQLLDAAPLYREYMVHLQKASIGSNISYWLQYLKEVEPCYLPTLVDNNKLPLRAMHSCKGDLTGWPQIVAIASQKGTTPSAILQTVWALVLRAYTHSSDVCFGYLTSGRDVPGIEDAVGVFINMLVCRLKLPDSLNLQSAIEHVGDSVAQGIKHENVSLARVQHELGLSGNPLFNTAYSFQRSRKAARREREIPSLQFDILNTTDPSEYTTINVEIEDDNAELQLCYWSNKLSDVQAKNIIHTFNHILDQIVRQPSLSLSVGEVDLLSSHSREQIVSWNKTKPAAVEKLVHEIFAENVHRQPRAPAVWGWDGEFSYAELDEVSSRLAHHLKSLGIGLKSFVPLCFEKSAWTIVAMMAVLKTGGAFVPLDSNHPQSRLQQLISGVGGKVALCSEGFGGLLVGTGVSIYEVGKKSISELRINNNENPLCDNITPDSAVCIMFTSGTTGVPKGTIMEHAAYCTGAIAHSAAVGILPDSRVFQFASYTWDASLMEILSTLIVGGCVCVPTNEERLNDMSGSIDRMRATWTLLTPSVARILRPEEVPSLKTLVTAGEQMAEGHIAKWAPTTSVVNAYGPCECSVVATASVKVDLNGNLLDSVPSNIGRAVGSRSWVVDPDNIDKLMPIGSIGELIAEGRTVAGGYLNDRVRTEEVFVNPPSWYFSETIGIAKNPKARMYKTGDLVRYNEDGTLVYLGRKDSQIKVNGQRIELGEIEHCVRRHAPEGASAAVDLVTHDGSTTKSLVAFISHMTFSNPDSTTAGNGAANSNEDELLLPVSKTVSAVVAVLNAGLTADLPSFMVPSLCIPVARMPWTTSGKLDRRCLRAIAERLRPEQKSAYLMSNVLASPQSTDSSASETSLTMLLKGIWSQVLRIPIESIDTHTSFLALGGDSIATMQVMSLSREKGIKFSLSDVLRSKSIAQLLEALESRPLAINSIPRDSVEGSGDTFALSPIQQMFFTGQPNEEVLDWYNQSFLLKLASKKSAPEVEEAIEKIIDRHSMLRARFSRSNAGAWKQRITTELRSSYRYLSVNIANPKDILPIVRSSQASLDLRKGPLLAATLFNVEELGQVLFINIHHLVVDAVSWLTILQDLETLLNRRKCSDDKPLSFQHWCNTRTEEARRLTGGERTALPFEISPANLSYWGMDNATNVYGDVVQRSFILNSRSTNLLLFDSHKSFKTEPLDVFLSALMHSFAVTFPSREIPTIYSEGHGRESANPEIDPSSTVGWFTSLCPIQITTAADYLQTVRQVKDVRRKIPGNGQSYFTQSLLDNESACKRAEYGSMEIMFNYLGRTQQVGDQQSILSGFDLEMTDEEREIITDVSPEISRMALIEVSAILSEEGLRFDFAYNKNMRHQSKLHDWMLACQELLSEAGTSLLCEAPQQATLADFPLMPMDYDQLHTLLDEVRSALGIVDTSKIEDIYPCSSMQEGILLAQYKKAGRYLSSTVFEVKPGAGQTTVDAPRLSAALDNVVAQHPVLRTLFVNADYEGGHICQVVLKSMDASITRLECHDIGVMAKLEESTGDTKCEPGNSRPLHHFTLCQTIEGKTFLRIELNHAVVDGASMPIIVRDLAEAYNHRTPLAPGAVYSAYVKYISGKNQSVDEAYWLEHLRDASPCNFPLHSDKQELFNTMSIDFDRLSELKARCAELEVTVSSAILTSWSMVLGNFTEMDGVCFGYLASGRDAPVNGVNNIVGPLINMLALHIQLKSSQSIGRLVKDVQRLHAGNMSHRNVSWNRVQHKLSSSPGPLFNTAVSIQQNSVALEHKGGIEFDAVTSHDPSEVGYQKSAVCVYADIGILVRPHVECECSRDPWGHHIFVLGGCSGCRTHAEGGLYVHEHAPCDDRHAPS